jgi:hypothetical protein
MLCLAVQMDWRRIVIVSLSWLAVSPLALHSKMSASHSQIGRMMIAAGQVYIATIDFVSLTFVLAVGGATVSVTSGYRLASERAALFSSMEAMMGRGRAASCVMHTKELAQKADDTCTSRWLQRHHEQFLRTCRR